MVALRTMELQRKTDIYDRGRHTSRRAFCGSAAVGALSITMPAGMWAQGATGVHLSVAEFDRERILAAANRALGSDPVSVVDIVAPGKRDAHLLYSERLFLAEGADLPEKTASPFVAHLRLLVHMNARLSALTAAWRLTHELRYRDAAWTQLRIWCLDPAKRMLPSLEYTGMVAVSEDDERNNGICETVDLAETARAAGWLCSDPQASTEEVAAVRQWFADLLTWFVDSKKGGIARDAKDLQAICWTAQAAEFAQLTRNDGQLRACAHLFRDRLLRQMSFDGNFPSALHTKRPYATSLFTLECLAMACESLSTPFESLWKINLLDGRGMRSAVAWAFPYMQNRGKWPYVADAQHFNDEPIRQNSLLFAGRAYNQPEYIELWKAMKPDSPISEIEETTPLTQPALWAVRAPA